MKKFFKRFMCLTLALVTLVMAGCSCKGETEKKPSVELPTAPEQTFETKDTYLIEKGRSDYAILLSDTPTVKEVTAKDELVLFFKEATGITLPVKTDSQITYTSDSKFISIGKTALALNKGVNPTFADVNENGFVIKTIDNSIFLAGFSEFGTLYAVYEFLYYEFDYDFYTEGCYELTKVKDDVKTKVYDIKSVPDINTMQSNYGYTINDEQTSNRYRMMKRNEIFLYVNGVGSVHNSIHILSPSDSKYADKNDEPYYSDQDGNPLFFDEDGNALPLNGDGEPYYEEGGKTYYFDELGSPYLKDGNGRYIIAKDGKSYYYDSEGKLYYLDGATPVYPDVTPEPALEKRAGKKLLEYFYMATGQDKAGDFDLCFSAHGDETKFEEMTDLFCDEIKDEFRAGAKGTMMVVGQRDINKVCTCEACTKITNDYGAASAIGVLFCNRVLEKVYAWFDDTSENGGSEYKREFNLMLLAYEKFVNAPVTKQSDGTYKVNNNLPVHEKLGIMSAPISFNYTVPKDENKESYETLNQWKNIANVFAFYSYDTNFQSFLVPFNTFESKADLYQTLDGLNCISIFDAGQGQDGADFLPSVWSMLKTYLESKLRWDTDADLNYYTIKYFNGVYKEGGEAMYNAYRSFRAHWNDMETRIANKEPLPIISDHMAQMEQAILWPKPILESWYAYMEQAREDIAYLKDENPEQYQTICDMISVERLSVGYLLATMHDKSYSQKELHELRLTVKADLEVTKHTVLGPLSKTVSGLLSSWGL